jgi:segregation and condensation protein B
MEQLKSRIEAVLFIAARVVQIEEIAEILGEPAEQVEEALLELIMDYSAREGALEIDDENGYILQVKTEHLDIVEKLCPVELKPAVLKTLTVIALKEPIRQSDLKELRGGDVYEHVSELVEKGYLVQDERWKSHCTFYEGKISDGSERKNLSKKTKARKTEPLLPKSKLDVSKNDTDNIVNIAEPPAPEERSAREEKINTYFLDFLTIINEIIKLNGVIIMMIAASFKLSINITTKVPTMVVIPESVAAKLARKPSVIMSMSFIILEMRSPCDVVSM